ncbi:MAG: transporter [Saprospiraceae bacterium]|nr:MAG: transporter [Saprospiraceae bacterium]
MSFHPKVVISTMILTLMSWSIFAQEVKKMSIQEAVNYAMDHSFTLKNAQIEIADAKEQIIERRAFGLPQLSASGNFQRYVEVPKQPLPQAFLDFFEAMNIPVERETSFFLKNNFTASADLDAMIFDGSFFVGLQAAKKYREYVAQEYVTKQREVKNQVKEAYLPVLLVQENIRLLEKNISNLEKLFFETSEMYKAGFSEQLDVDRLQLSLANLKVERDNLMRQREVAISNLKFAMNFPIEEALDVADDLETLLSPVSDQALNSEANLNLRPEIALLNMGIGLNEINIKLNKSAYLPTLRAYGAYQYQYQGNNSSDGFWAPAAYVGLKLNVPIFDGLNKKAKIQRARLDLEKTINQKAELERGIDLEVQNARITYLGARERLASQQENLALAERIYETTQIKYREGVGSSLEVNQAEQSLYTSQSNYMQSLYDLISAQIGLDKALGQ